MKTPITKSIRLLAAAVSALGITCIANAVTYSVSLDTNSLIGNSFAPFYLDFQLTDGSGSNNGNNTASVSDFQFGGGHAVGAAFASGGASGDVATGITLTDTDFWNDIYQEFVPGSVLSFLVTLSNNIESGSTPDLFSFSILDSGLGYPANIPTESGAFTLLEIGIDGSPLTVETFSGIDDGFGTDYSAISAPSVSTVSTVPDSPVFAAGLASLIALFVARRRLDRQTA